MSSHAPKVDPVSKLFFFASLIAILLVVYIFISSLVSVYKKNSLKGDVDTSHLVAAVSSNLKPVGFSSTSDAPAAGATGRGGKEIYDAVCASCHATGVLDAPKLDDKATWEARSKDGLDAVITSAKNGKGSMPAKGGDPSITDSELKAVIIYMTKEAGLDLGGSEPETIEKKDDTKVETNQSGEATSVTKKAVKKKSVVSQLKIPKQPVVPATPVVSEAPVVSSAPVLEKTVETPKPSIDGKKVYDTACFACHASGVAGSPKLGDKDVWVSRLASGIEALYKTALKGKGAMPPKGGNMSLPDADVKAAVDYMVDQVK